MDEKKQIEEITKILDSNCEGIPDTVCQENSCSSCKAKQIIGAGYRKQSVGEWIFNKGRTYGEPAYYCSNCWEGESYYGFDKFCPNCGAKMGGGEE